MSGVSHLTGPRSIGPQQNQGSRNATEPERSTPPIGAACLVTLHHREIRAPTQPSERAKPRPPTTQTGTGNSGDSRRTRTRGREIVTDRPHRKCRRRQLRANWLGYRSGRNTFVRIRPSEGVDGRGGSWISLPYTHRGEKTRRRSRLRSDHRRAGIPRRAEGPERKEELPAMECRRRFVSRQAQ